MAQWPDDYPTQDQICFLLDGRIHRVSSVPTDRTLLQYLRETLLQDILNFIMHHVGFGSFGCEHV